MLRKGSLISAVECALLVQYDSKVWCLDGEKVCHRQSVQRPHCCAQVCSELVAQYVWRKWENFDTFLFDPPILLRELLVTGIETQNLNEQALGMTKEKYIEHCLTTLARWANMLNEYWQISIKAHL